jgi:hypothetical protein
VLLKNLEEEKEFLSSAALSIQLLDTEGLDSVARIKEVSQGISDAFSLVGQKCAKEVTITLCSKPWWNQECTDTIRHYREDRSPQKWKSFCHATCKAKRVFFNAHIEEISKTTIPLSLLPPSSTSLFTSYFHHLWILVVIHKLLLCLHTLVALPILPGVIERTMTMK